jgi:glycosyltransferase involved in cell wall biosynthesis
MNIVIVSAAYPLRGGIAQSTSILYHKLQQRGHRVQVITFKRQYPKLFFPGTTQVDTSQDGSAKIVTESIIDSIGPFTWVKAYKRIRQLKPDLLLFRYWMPFFAPCFGTISWLVKKFTDAKVLFLCDNVIPHERRPGDVTLTRFAFNHADYFIVQSQVVKNDLLNLFPKATYRVVPHPLYEIFGEAIDKSDAKKKLGLVDDRIILFFGYVRAYKGLDTLLKALPEVLKDMPVKVLVVGEFYENEEDYRKLLRDLRITDAVHIVSKFVANEQVYLYFSAADLVVLPYKSATQSGIVQIAYHLNKPCIVTDVGGLAEVVIHGKTGYVVPSDRPTELAAAIKKFYLENREREFAEHVKVEKQKYSWDNMVNAIEELSRS